MRRFLNALASSAVWYSAAALVATVVAQAPPLQIEGPTILLTPGATPVSSIGWNFDAEGALAGTIEGKLRQLPDSAPQAYAIDEAEVQSCLGFAVNRHHLTVVGFATRPKLWLLPGERLGNVIGLDREPSALESEARTSRIAALYPNKVQVVQRGNGSWRRTFAGSNLTTMSWIGERFARNNEPGVSRLAVGDQVGKISVWQMGPEDKPQTPETPAAVFELPLAGQGMLLPPLKLIDLTGSYGDRVFASADSGGTVRKWRVPPEVESIRTVPSGSVLAQGDGGQFVTIYTAGKLTLFDVEAREEKLSITPSLATAPDLVVHQQLVGGAHYLIAVWYGTTPASRVEIYASSSSTPATPVMSGDFSAKVQTAAVNHDGKQAAVALALDTVHFLTAAGAIRAKVPSPPPVSTGPPPITTPTPTATPTATPTGTPPGITAPTTPAAPPPPTFDGDIRLLRYSPDGKRLFSVGARLSVFDAAAATPAQLGMSEHDLAWEVCDMQLKSPAVGNDVESAVLVTDVLGATPDSLELFRVDYTTTDHSKPVETSQVVVRAANKPLASIRLHDKRCIVASVEDAAVWHVDPDGGDPLVPLERRSGFSAPVRSAALSTVPASEAFVVVSDVVLRRQICVTSHSKPSTHELTHLKSDAQGTLFAAVDDGTVYKIAGDQADLLQGAAGWPITALAVSHDGKTLLAGLANMSLRSWTKTDPSEKEKDSPPLNAKITALYYAPDSRTFFLGKADGELFRYRPKGSDSMGEQWMRCSGFASGNSVNAVTTLHDGYVVDNDAPPLDIVGGPDPRLQVVDRIVASAVNMEVAAWSARPELGYRLVPTAGSSRPSPYYAVTHDGAGRVAAVGIDGQVRFWNAPDVGVTEIDTSMNLSDDKIDSLATQKVSNVPLYAAAFDRTVGNGPCYVGGADGLVRAVSVTGIVQTSPASPHLIYCLAAHPGKKLLVVGRGAWTAIAGTSDTSTPTASAPELLEAFAGGLTNVKPWPGHTNSVLAASFSGQGELLATADRSDKLIVWDCRNIVAGSADPPPKLLEQSLSSRPLSLSWRSQGNHVTELAVGTNDGRVFVYVVK